MPRPLPRGPHRLTRETVLESQRGRMLDAMAQVVAVKGYGATTVADVIDCAGVSRRTFYEQFTDKEACFLAAYDTCVEILLGAIRAADGPSARISAYLGTLASEPALARTFLIEIGAAGPRALERRTAVHDAFAEVLADLAPDASRELRLAAVGATDTLVTRWVSQGRAAELPALQDTVVHIHASLLS